MHWLDLPLPALIWIGLGYLLGSIPFGLLLTRAAGLGDIRQIGSGNIGATNVLRTGRRGLAALTVLLDGGKAGLAVLITRYFTPDELLPALAGAAAFCGHIFPLWLGFRGGKGVATFIGMLLALAPALGLVFCGLWLIGLALTRMSSAAALIAASAIPPLTFVSFGPALGVICLAVGLLIFVRHKANIRRLWTSTEPRVTI